MKKNKYKIIIACEESQAICIEFRKRGFEAFSCDILECSGGHPEWHIQGDAIKVIMSHHWDLMIAHPPCTFLANSGISWLYNKDGSKNEERWDNMRKGAEFFVKILKAPIHRIAVENPIPHEYAIRLIKHKYDQIIQPYQFGTSESKATCLWLKNLPRLKETENKYTEYIRLPKTIGQRLHYLPPGPERAKMRSKTFPGVAKAIAEQWGDFLINPYPISVFEI